jgi:AbiU2
MIYIIGIHHEIQYWDGSDSPFLISLRNWCSMLNLSIIAEELNEEAIARQETFRKQSLVSVAQKAASILNLEHRFCDPNTSQRADLKILTKSEVRKNLGLRVGQDEDLVEKEEMRLYWPLREKFWLNRIRDKSEEGILFICGVSHVTRFLSLLEANGMKSVILHKDWVVESKLDDILSEGVVRDVYEAKLAKQLATFFGNNAGMLNSEYPHLFGNLQRILTVWIFLAVARVFEEKNPRSPHPIRSIPEALKILEGGNVLIKNKSRAISALNVAESERNRLALASEADFLTSICQYFRTRLEALSDSIKNIKEKRDKVIAHREAIDELDVARPNWGDLEDLIALAKCFYEVVGEGIMGRPIDSDPEVLTRSFKRLLTQAGVKVS